MGFWPLPLVLSPVRTRDWAFRRLGKVGGRQGQLMVSHLQLFLVLPLPLLLPIMSHKDRGPAVCSRELWKWGEEGSGQPGDPRFVFDPPTPSDSVTYAHYLLLSMQRGTLGDTILPGSAPPGSPAGQCSAASCPPGLPSHRTPHSIPHAAKGQDSDTFLAPSSGLGWVQELGVLLAQNGIVRGTVTSEGTQGPSGCAPQESPGVAYLVPLTVLLSQFEH